MKRVYLLAMLALLLALAACGGADRNEEGEIVEEGDVSAFDLQVGDCVNGLVGDVDEVSSVGAVPCDQAHDNEVYHLADFDAGPDEAFPGEPEIDEFANEACVTAFEPYVGTSYDTSAYFVTYLQPTEGTWEDGDREVVCVLYEQDADGNAVQMTGSARGSNR